MKKDTKVIKLGNGDVRHECVLSFDKILLEAGETQKGKLLEVVRTMYDNPLLIAANGQTPQKIVITFDGEKWIVKLEAITNDEVAF